MVEYCQISDSDWPEYSKRLTSIYSELYPVLVSRYPRNVIDIRTRCPSLEKFNNTMTFDSGGHPTKKGYALIGQLIQDLEWISFFEHSLGFLYLEWPPANSSSSTSRRRLHLLLLESRPCSLVIPECSLGAIADWKFPAGSNQFWFFQADFCLFSIIDMVYLFLFSFMIEQWLL